MTVHDPQPDSPQLNLVPVNPKSPLRKYSSNVWDCDGLDNETRFPETCFKSNKQIQNRPNYLDRYFWIPNICFKCIPLDPTKTKLYIIFSRTQLPFR